MDLWLARQPIFDSRTHVVAYELLYRSGTSNAYDGSDGNAATARVINASFYSPGGREILGRKRAFINFPKDLLASGGAALLPPEEVVIEILETVIPDLGLILACNDLHSRGYKLALDDFVPCEEANPLASIADYIKVDFRATFPSQQAEVVRRWGKKACMLAEKVETLEEFERARILGYSLFQGYFFARPVVVSTQDVPAAKLNQLRILQQLQFPEMDFAAMGELVSQDCALAYKLLRFVNSALFAAREPIDSIQQTMVRVGELGMRRWLTVLLLTGLSANRPGELAVNALMRARFCELLATEVDLASRSGDLFLLGLLSHLDAMYGRPIHELLSGLNLRNDIAEILLGAAPPSSQLAGLWATVLAYEQGDWDRMHRSAATAQIRTSAVQPLYAAAVRWADQVVHGGIGEEPDSERAPSETSTDTKVTA